MIPSKTNLSEKTKKTRSKPNFAELASSESDGESRSEQTSPYNKTYNQRFLKMESIKIISQINLYQEEK